MTTMTCSRPSPWRWLGWALLLGVLVVAIAGAVSLAVLFNDLPPDLLITVDGEPIQLHGLAAGHAWLVFSGIILAFVVVVVVVPLVVVFGVGVPLVLAGLGVIVALVVAGVAVALVGSPVILLGLLLWWAVRPRKRPAAASAAPAGPVSPPPMPVVGEHTDNSTPFA